MTAAPSAATIGPTYGFPLDARLLLLLPYAHVLFRHTGAGGVVTREEIIVSS